MNAQIKKGVLEMLVLGFLSVRDRYGFELISSISRNIEISEGTIYPLLKRLKEDGFVETYLMESSEGPPRKYYKLTDTGKNAYTEQLEEWEVFVSSVQKSISEVAL